MCKVTSRAPSGVALPIFLRFFLAVQKIISEICITDLFSDSLMGLKLGDRREG